MHTFFAKHIRVHIYIYMYVLICIHADRERERGEREREEREAGCSCSLAQHEMLIVRLMCYSVWGPGRLANMCMQCSPCSLFSAVVWQTGIMSQTFAS